MVSDDLAWGNKGPSFHLEFVNTHSGESQDTAFPLARSWAFHPHTGKLSKEGVPSTQTSLSRGPWESLCV